MNKFEAGEKFLELFKTNPNDFSVEIDSGRDHNCMCIKNKYRAAGVVLDILDNSANPSSLGNGEIIRYLSQQTVIDLYNLGLLHIAKEKEQVIIDSDNKVIEYLFDYYKNNV